ncbi:MAG: DUF2017 family protein [Opitutaceae bacterium]|nr:DUF2017 family protein [Opitutaceae bacterium]
MKHIEVKLSLDVVAPLLDVIREMADSLRRSLAAPLAMENLDAEMRTAWVDELLTAQNADLRVLLALFGEEFFKEGVISLDEENGEPVIRACAAVRLRLREQHLREVDDDVMESGEVAPDALAGPTRKAFMCYLFLSTMQELIIQHLNPASAEQ